jgi:hypothetical protein
MPMLAAAAAVIVPTDTQDDDVMRALIDNAGPIAMCFVVALGIALVFLYRSMRKQMSRIDPSIPESDRERARDAADELPLAPDGPADPAGPAVDEPSDDEPTVR